MLFIVCNLQEWGVKHVNVTVKIQPNKVMQKGEEGLSVFQHCSVETCAQAN